MALISFGKTTCPLCQQVISDKTDCIAFPYISPIPKKYNMLNDGVAHRSCLSRWENREDFIRCWNIAAPSAKTKLHIDSAGLVKLGHE
jgi:hypothetical protein